MRSRRAAFFAPLCGLAVLLAACSSPVAQGTPTSEPVSSHVPLGYDLIGCHPIDLRAPTGELIDLTGLWGVSGQDPQFQIRQLDSCVFMAGKPAFDEDLGWVCDGEITTEFRIIGRCVQLATGDFQVWDRQLSFSENGDVIFEPLCGNGGPGFDCGPPTVRLHPDASPAPSSTGQPS